MPKLYWTIRGRDMTAEMLEYCLKVAESARIWIMDEGAETVCCGRRNCLSRGDGSDGRSGATREHLDS